MPPYNGTDPGDGALTGERKGTTMHPARILFTTALGFSFALSGAVLALI
ncbi:hypothetical protein JL811_01405 [Tabrizicola sp. DMG-N-6]|uniref:Uncharacterized protein n=1 Tax=Szabonella alba TaxID=2804194 RepID=A0A8K0V5P2_9RHOB|nr:hypothetical protein [Szabonella alba]